MLCNNCGNKLDDGAKFCMNCGTAFTGFAPAPDLTDDTFCREIPSRLAGSTPAYVPTKPTAPIPVYSKTAKAAEPKPVYSTSPKAAEPSPEQSESPKPVTSIPVHATSEKAAVKTVPQKPVPTSSKVVPAAPSTAAKAVRTYQQMPFLKRVCCSLLFLVVFFGGLYAIIEGDSGSGSGSGGSRGQRNQGNSSYSSSGNYYNYDYDYGYDYGYDYDGIGGNDYSSRIDCPACVGGRHSLCNGSGTYRNYGEAVDCTCNNGTCTLCGGDGYR